jgi:hypothetical protein
LGDVDELPEGRGGSVDTVIGAATSPYRVPDQLHLHSWRPLMRRWAIFVVALLLTVGFASGGHAQAPGGSGEKTMEKDKMEKGKMMEKKGKMMEKKGGKMMEKKDGAMDKMEKKEEKK